MLMPLTCAAILSIPSLDEARVLDARLLHLGNDQNERFADVALDPQGTRLDLEFEAKANATENVLFVTQRDVSDEWFVELNGARLGTLRREAGSVNAHFRVPRAKLISGVNRLAIYSAKVSDDIILGNVRLDSRSLADALGLERVTVTIRDRATRAAVPARVDFIAKDGGPRPDLVEPTPDLAVRQGLAYTATGRVEAWLPKGEFRVVATRGMEWGMAEASLALDGVNESTLALEIEREVDTTGYVAADTHLHTLTYSGHGDSNLEERVVTLAAQGVELAIATDHNHHTDYRPIQRAAHLDGAFTAVTGNEVTTDIGHFTAFPFDPKGAVPNWKLTDHVKLVSEMRSKGAKVVFLNHPRWPQIETGVFANWKLDRKSGERTNAPEITVDGIEILNTNTMLADPMFLPTDWFALLNAGHRVWAVASSDTHTVGEPCGMGRTYVASATDDPAAIDVDAACENFVAGRFSAAFGIFTDLTVNGKRSGETVAVRAVPVTVKVVVRHPRWVHATRVVVFVNGIAAGEKPLPDYAGPKGHTIEFLLNPKQDAHVVAIAFGDHVDGAWWPTSGKYTIGVTNPVMLDVDGDGKSSSPREIAEKLLSHTDWMTAITSVDEATAIQVAALQLAKLDPKLRGEFEAFVAAGADGRASVAEFLTRRLAEAR